MIGQRLGNYLLVREIGQGGMATVYEGVHVQLGGRAAVKVLRRDLSENPTIAARFLNEGRAVNLVEHPGVVRIFEFGKREESDAYIIMEYLEGETLAQRLRRLGGTLEPLMVLRLGRQMASALAVAHDRGIVHRDLKPDNVMITMDPEAAGGERARLLDFGIAKILIAPLPAPDAVATPHAMTQVGTFMGTPGYMAPEQCRSAEEVDARADVYSLGVLMYQMLCGRLPFDARTPMDVMAAHLYLTPPPLTELAPEVPRPLSTLVHRMLIKDREARPSMWEVLDELEAQGAAPGPGQGGPAGPTWIAPQDGGRVPSVPTIAAAAPPDGRGAIQVGRLLLGGGGGAALLLALVFFFWRGLDGPAPSAPGPQGALASAPDLGAAAVFGPGPGPGPGLGKDLRSPDRDRDRGVAQGMDMASARQRSRPGPGPTVVPARGAPPPGPAGRAAPPDAGSAPQDAMQRPSGAHRRMTNEEVRILD